MTRFVQPEKIEIDANERAVNEKSPYCFFVCTTFDSFLNDLIAEFNGKLNKIQVKTSISKAENGTVTFDVTSSSLHRKNGSKAKYTKNDIDYFFCYNIETNKSFLIEAPETPVNMITIRIDPPKNKQVKNIRNEKDYLFENVIKSFDIIGM